MASSALANWACAGDKLKLPMSNMEASERNFMKGPLENVKPV
jgi:hypothetical protein